MRLRGHVNVNGNSIVQKLCAQPKCAGVAGYVAGALCVVSHVKWKKNNPPKMMAISWRWHLVLGNKTKQLLKKDRKQERKKTDSQFGSIVGGAV